MFVSRLFAHLNHLTFKSCVDTERILKEQLANQGAFCKGAMELRNQRACKLIEITLWPQHSNSKKAGIEMGSTRFEDVFKF
jgi:hypothetical protein